MHTTRRLRLTWLDAILVAAFALFVGYTAHRITTTLTYHWDWSAIPRYLLRWDDESQSWTSNLLLEGLLTTIRLMIWASLIAGPIGIIMGLCRASSVFLPRYIGGLYVNLVRNMPPLVFMFIFYYFISSQIIPWLGLDSIAQDATPEQMHLLQIAFGDPNQLSDFLAGVIALALFEGAYVTEIIRAGIQAVERGQSEASLALGLNGRQTLQSIVLPQAFRKVAPALTGQFISLVKDSTIVSLIAIPDLAFRGNQVSASTGAMFEVWLTVAAFYLALCLLLGRLAAFWARRTGARPSGTRQWQHT
jgi:polar amino acid transport system permease protein